MAQRRSNAPQHLPSGPFGFGEDQWDQAKKIGRKRLIAVAQDGLTITYSELVDEIELPLEAHDIRFFSLLGEISTDEHREGRPLLSVLVVHKAGDGQPGPGFFELAQSLGHDASDVERLWIEECKRVYAHWGEA